MSSFDALAPARLGGLELLPVDEHLVGAGDLHLAEHVRMAVDELLDEPSGDVVDVPAALVGGDLRMEDHLEQHVAELVADRGVVARVDRLDQLVRLLQQVPGEGAVGLLGVPRTPARAAEPRHDPHEIEQPLALLRRRAPGPRGTWARSVVRTTGRALTAWAEAAPEAGGVAVSLGFGARDRRRRERLETS